MGEDGGSIGSGFPPEYFLPGAGDSLTLDVEGIGAGVGTTHGVEGVGGVGGGGMVTQGAGPVETGGMQRLDDDDVIICGSTPSIKPDG